MRNSKYLKKKNNNQEKADNSMNNYLERDHMLRIDIYISLLIIN